MGGGANKKILRIRLLPRKIGRLTRRIGELTRRIGELKSRNGRGSKKKMPGFTLNNNPNGCGTEVG